MAYRIRPFRPEDAVVLAEIFRSAINRIGPQSYSEKQVAAWVARAPEAAAFVARMRARDMIMVAAGADDRAIAYAILERDGHLDHLYCHPAHTRRGIADALLAEAEQRAREIGVSRLYSEASEMARPAFARAGYRVTHRRDFEVDGVAIHNFAMEKLLA